MKKTIITIITLALIGIGSIAIYNEKFDNKNNLKIKKEIPISMNQSEIDLKHKWVIYFDHGVDKNLVNSRAIFVLDKDKNKISVKLKVKNDKTLIIEPPSEGYVQGETFDMFINRDLDLEHAGDKKLPEQSRIHFSTDSKL